MTTENNRLILNFMEVKPHKTGNTFGWSDMPFYSCNHPTQEEVMQSVSKYVKYSTDWNALMPVVEKIESIKVEDYSVLVEISKNICTICPAHWEELINIQSNTRIEAVYDAIIDFINWYNKQK